MLKLQQWDISGLFYKNIKSMYQSVSYVVKVHGGYLDPIASKVGLKPGGVLGPILFNIFVDDLKVVFNDSCDTVLIFEITLSHLLYADDLALLSTSAQGLNNCLSKLSGFCDTWKLKLNDAKRKILVFNPQGRLCKSNKFTYNDSVLEIVQKNCYLGVEFSPSESFKKAKNVLSEKGRKAMLPLMSIIAQFKLPIVDSLHLFRTYIKPILLYNCENWALLTSHQINALKDDKSSLLAYLFTDPLETTHQRYIKYILGVNKSCSNYATLGELGKLPIYYNAMLQLLNFWHHVALMNYNTLVKKAYIVQCNNENLQWIATVKFVLKLIGMGHLITNPNYLSVPAFKRECKLKLSEYLTTQWLQVIRRAHKGSSNSKLSLYKTFKQNFSMEAYLKLLPDFHHRKVITKFRCSDHKLQVELGRHTKTQRMDRICNMCQKQVETEQHFLAYCPVFANIRKKYLNSVNKDLRQFLVSTDKKQIYNLVNFLVRANKIRETSSDRSDNEQSYNYD